MYTVSIITLSDKGYEGTREDLSGPFIENFLKQNGNFDIQSYTILPDDQQMLIEHMVDLCDDKKVHLILTTGGTGFSHRDITPEATLEVIDRHVPGIPEAMRWYSLQITPRAMLSRAESGIRKNTLIINLPGSPKAVGEILEYIMPSVEHGLDILNANASECARK